MVDVNKHLKLFLVAFQPESITVASLLYLANLFLMSSFEELSLLQE